MIEQSTMGDGRHPDISNDPGVSPFRFLQSCRRQMSTYIFIRPPSNILILKTSCSVEDIKGRRCLWFTRCCLPLPLLLLLALSSLRDRG